MNQTLPQNVTDDKVRRHVRARYGAIAQSGARGCGAPAAVPATETGCAAGGCCGPAPAASHSATLGYTAADEAAAPAGSELGLGCGNPTTIASIRPGETILDLGSGAGFDCFIAARATGSAGRVIGVDMTPEMISRARTNAAKGEFANVDFRLGEIENLPVADNTADLIISNCVVNLSPNKARVMAEAHRALKPGGRVAISDIVALQPLPSALRDDFAAYTGCVAGAIERQDYERLLHAAGFAEVRIELKPGSEAMMDNWAPGKNAGAYVASAIITARKPL